MKVLFKNGNLKFESRLINGTYPNTANLLPDDSYLVVSTNLNDFYSVIDRVSILTSDKEKNIVTLETDISFFAVECAGKVVLLKLVV